MARDLRFADLMTDLLIEQRKTNELLTVLNQTIITVAERLQRVEKDGTRHTTELGDLRNSMIELASKIVKKDIK